MPSKVVNANPSDPLVYPPLSGLDWKRDLLSLQYKENKGKFSASNGRLHAKSFSALGGLCPLTPDQGLCPWTPLGAAPPDPPYRLALPRSPCAPSLWPPLFFTFRGLCPWPLCKLYACWLGHRKKWLRVVTPPLFIAYCVGNWGKTRLWHLGGENSIYQAHNQCIG